MIGRAACLALMMLAPLAGGRAQPAHGPGADQLASRFVERSMFTRKQLGAFLEMRVGGRVIAAFEARGKTDEDAYDYVNRAVPAVVATNAPALQSRLQSMALAAFGDSELETVLGGGSIDPSSDLGVRLQRFAKEVDAATLEWSEIARMDFFARNASALRALGYTLPAEDPP